jgi:alpha-L-rhamnosidase
METVSDVKLTKTFPNDCCWITDCWHSDGAPALNRYYAFRNVIKVPGEIETANLLITANARYQLWINGETVSRGPARCYPHNQSYDVLDVGKYLRKGENSIAVLVHNPGRSTAQYLHQRGAGLLCSGEVLLRSGEKIRIRTDATWLGREADWYLHDDAMISVWIGFQEHYDAGNEPAEWKTCPLDQLHGWNNALPLGSPDIQPYTRLTPRATQSLVEEPVDASPVVSGVFRPSDEKPDSSNLRLKLESGVVERRPMDAVAKSEGNGWYTFLAQPDGANLITFDLGQTMPVRLALEIEDASKIELVEMYYSESLTDSGMPICGCGLGRCDEGDADSYVPAPHVPGFFETFGLRGCRFVTVVAYLKSDARIQLSARHVHYPVERLPFECSDETINAFWKKSDRTLQTCMLDTYIDCCNREQALWIFDACVQGIAAFYIYGDTALLRRSLEVTGDSALPGGLLRNVGPMMPCFMVMVDQTLEWLQTCLDYALLSGDVEFLLQIENSACDFMERCLKEMTSEGLLIPPPGTWHWNDWANLDRRPYSLLVNARLFGAACAGQRMAALCNSARLNKVSMRIRNILKKSLPRFYSPEEGAFLEHIDVGPGVENLRGDENLYPLGFPAGFKVNIQSPCSIHSNAVMLSNRLLDPDLFSEEMADGALNFLVTELSRDFNPVNQFGPGWIEKIFRPLFEYGQDRVAIRLIKRIGEHWGKGGAPTWPETFDANGKYNSAHGWGAAMNTLFGTCVLGITPLSPGFSEFAFDVRPGDVSSCSGTVRTGHGEITASWRREGNAIVAEMGVPKGCVCKLPDGRTVAGPLNTILRIEG